MLATQQSDLITQRLDELVHEELIEPAREWRGGSSQDFHFHHAPDARSGPSAAERVRTGQGHAAAGNYLSQGQPEPSAARRALPPRSERSACPLLPPRGDAGQRSGRPGYAAGPVLNRASLRRDRSAARSVPGAAHCGLASQRALLDLLRESHEALALLERAVAIRGVASSPPLPGRRLLEGKSLPGLMQTFLSTNPDADARATYVHGRRCLSIMLGILVSARAVRLRASGRARSAHCSTPASTTR